MTRMVAWVYGLLPPRDWDEECEREANHGQIKLWNTLVAIEEKRRAGEGAIYRRDIQLGQIMHRLAEIERRLAEIPRRAASEAEIAERSRLWLDQRTLWAAAKPLRAIVRSEHEDAFRALRDERYAAITEARHASGLWWGNYNAVCAAFDVALGRLGPGEMVRPHRESGDARLTNQLQGGIAAAALVPCAVGLSRRNVNGECSSEPASGHRSGDGNVAPAPGHGPSEPLSPASGRGNGEGISSGHPQVRIDLMPEGDPLLIRGAGRKGTLRLLSVTVASAGRGTRRMASWPIVWHRELPEGARVMQVIVQRRQIAARSRPGRDNCRWQAIFVCRLPDVPASRDRGDEQVSNRVAGIDIGWRQIEGGLRVATIAGSDGSLDHIVLPRKWLDRQERIARQIGDARIAKDAGDEATAAHLARVISHGRDKMLLARREIYRVAAKAIAEKFGTVAIDADIKEMTKRRYAGTAEMPQATRRMRTWSAPHELVAEIARAVKARGGQVLYAKGRSTQTCHRCGHVNSGIPEAWRADLVWRCEGCKKLWDQDENAARNLCAAAQGTSGDAPITLVSKENKGLSRARMTRKASAQKTTPNEDEVRP